MKKRYLKHLGIVLILIIGLMASWIVYFYSSQYDEDKLKARIERNASSMANEIKVGFELNNVILESIRSFFLSSSYVDRDEFSSFVNPFLKNYQYIRAFEWVPNITLANLENMVEKAKIDGYPDFKITEFDDNGNIKDANKREVYFPVYYLEPMKGNEKVFGLDLLTNEIRAAALIKAANVDMIQTTSRIQLVQENQIKYAALEIVPIFKINDQIKKTIDSVTGFVVGAIIYDEFLQDRLTDKSFSNFDIYLFDLTARSDNQFLAKFTKNRMSDQKEYFYYKVLEENQSIFYEEKFDVGGRKLSIVIVPNERYLNDERSQYASTLAILTFFLVGMFAFIYRIRINEQEKIREEVNVRTDDLKNAKNDTERINVELREANEKKENVLMESEKAKMALLNIMDDFEKEKIKLEQSEKRLNLAVQGGNAGIWDWYDIEKTQEWWSDKFYELIGYKRDELASTLDNFNKLMHPADRKRTFEAVDEHLRNGASFNVEYRLQLKDGDYKWFNGRGEAMRDEKGNAIRMTGTIVDIHDRKILELATKELTEELERSNRDLEQFAYVASHDLQEPLRMVASFTQLIEKKYNDKLDDSGKEYIHFAVDGSKRMQKLIDDLLTFSRVGKKDAKLENVKLNDVIDEIKLDLKVLIEENNVNLNSESLPEIFVNQLQVKQVFLNLITNAIKFIPKGNKPQIDIKSTEEGEFYVFSVKDNGLGIEDKYLEKIFIIFQRLHTKEQYQGTGIGLAVCKKIIENYGGRIWVESKVGKGSTFYFTIKKKKWSDS